MTTNTTGRTISARTPGSPYDNGIYQAGTRYTPAVGVAAEDLLPMCGQIANFDQTTHCLRLIRTVHLHRDLEEINRNLASLNRMRNDWRARNLIGWIEFAIRRLTFQMTEWDFPVCTCADRALASPTHDLEQVYPTCSC